GFELTRAVLKFVSLAVESLYRLGVGEALRKPVTVLGLLTQLVVIHRMWASTTASPPFSECGFGQFCSRPEMHRSSRRLPADPERAVPVWNAKSAGLTTCDRS